MASFSRGRPFIAYFRSEKSLRHSIQLERVEKHRADRLCVGPFHGGGMPSIRRVKRVQGLLLRWFERADRAFPWRKIQATKYERVVAEVLLQRTKADVVSRMFAPFVAQYPSWAS